MGFAGVYAELPDINTLMENIFFESLDFKAKDFTYLTRKYMYIYAGFSINCTTACFDTWRYEIAYAPLAFYPVSGHGV